MGYYWSQDDDQTICGLEHGHYCRVYCAKSCEKILRHREIVEIKTALRYLPKIPKLIVDRYQRQFVMKYLHDNGMSFARIGRYYGITRERVKQIVTKADRILGYWPVPKTNKEKRAQAEVLRLWNASKLIAEQIHANP